eukprot:8515543-Pyramimonas_sp.AAC.1
MLDASHTVSDGELNKKFRAKARVLHPDISRGDEEKMSQLNICIALIRQMRMKERESVTNADLGLNEQFIRKQQKRS